MHLQLGGALSAIIRARCQGPGQRHRTYFCGFARKGRNQSASLLEDVHAHAEVYSDGAYRKRSAGVSRMHEERLMVMPKKSRYIS